MISGLARVRLDTRVPVISDVLTPQNFHEHDEHKKFFYDHFVVKGAEAAAACAATVDKIARLQSPSRRAGQATESAWFSSEELPPQSIW